MKAIAILPAAAALLFGASAATAAAPYAAGEWITQGGLSHVRIASCSREPQKLCGAIVALKDSLNPQGKPKTDVNNPNASLHSRPIIGMTFLSGFSSAGAGKWSGGTIYDPQSGKTYKSKMTLNPDGTLKVEGCVLFICRGQVWSRAR